MEDKYKQIIIVRKDLEMTPGKMSAQVSHASMAFLSTWVKENINEVRTKDDYYIIDDAVLDKGLVDGWINGIFTKVVLGAKNKNQLLKAQRIADELGMKEGEDYFLIKDNCLTELEPEEVDENGVGRTLTCIGFKPMPASIIDQIGKKFQIFQ